MWSKFNFSEHGHIAYKIKGNHHCSNMVEIFCPQIPNLPPPPPPPDRRSSKVQIKLFQNMVTLHIKSKGSTKCSNIVANILFRRPLPTPTPLTLGFGSKGRNSTFSELGHVAYQIKENHECSNMAAYFACRSPDPVDGVNRSNFNRSNFNFFRTWS